MMRSAAGAPHHTIYMYRYYKSVHLLPLYRAGQRLKGSPSPFTKVFSNGIGCGARDQNSLTVGSWFKKKKNTFTHNLWAIFKNSCQNVKSLRTQVTRVSLPVFSPVLCITNFDFVRALDIRIRTLYGCGCGCGCGCGI